MTDGSSHISFICNKQLLQSSAVCKNHAPATLAALALIYSIYWLLVVWIIVAHFHLCSLLDRYTVLEVSAVRRPMRVCCGSRWGWCVLFTNIWDSLTASCLVYNTAMYTVYGWCNQYGRCMFIHWQVRPVRGLYGPFPTVYNHNKVGILLVREFAIGELAYPQVVQLSMQNCIVCLRSY